MREKIVRVDTKKSFVFHEIRGGDKKERERSYNGDTKTERERERGKKSTHLQDRCTRSRARLAADTSLRFHMATGRRGCIRSRNSAPCIRSSTCICNAKDFFKNHRHRAHKQSYKLSNDVDR